MTKLSAFFDFPTTRLDFVSDVIDPQPDHRAPELAETNGYPYVGIRDVNSDGSINVQTARKVKLEAVKKQELAFRIVPGDIVFCKVGTLGLPRRIKPIPQMALSATLVLIKPQTKVDSQFLFYALDSDSTKSQCDLESTGSTRQALGIQQIRRFDIPFASLETQKSIAHFLDRKTAAIDTLIAKKQRLIQLLEEKRTALINQAVTKGLNPNAPMKDSGIPWIGEIPEHWEVSRLGFAAHSIQTGPFGSQLHANDYVENGIPTVNPVNMKAGRIIPDYKKTISKEMGLQLSRHILNVGDLVLARRGELGRCGLVEKKEAGWLCGTGSIRVRLNQNIIYPSYFNLYMQLEGVASWLSVESVGSTMENLNTEILSRLPVLLPNKEEQIRIFHAAKERSFHVENIMEAVEKQIEKLQEYRRSLITAAVTGKLDVHNLNQET